MRTILTECTGGRWRAAENQESPPSAEPKTSPDVAPKKSPSGSRPSEQKAWRRVVRYASF